MKRPSLTIKPQVNENAEQFTESVETFHENRIEKNLTPAAYFTELLKNENSEASSTVADSLQERINQLTESIQSIQAENDRLLRENSDLQNLNLQLTQDIEAVNQQVNSAEEKISAIESESAAKVSLKYPEFVCSLPIEVADNIRKVRDWFYYNGFSEKEDKAVYVNEFMTYAARYLLINEFKKQIK